MKVDEEFEFKTTASANGYYQWWEIFLLAGWLAIIAGILTVIVRTES